MRVIKKQEVKVLEQTALKDHPNYKRMDAYRHVKRCLPFLCVIGLIGSNLLALLMPQSYREWLLGIQQPSAMKRIAAVFKIIALFAGVLVVMVPLHEMIHAVVLGFCKCYVMFQLPSVSVYCDRWIPKCRMMLAMILPFVTYTVIAAILFLISGEWYPCVWFMWINLLFASTDIFMFVYILLQIPRNALICGYYYDISKEFS